MHSRLKLIFHAISAFFKLTFVWSEREMQILSPFDFWDLKKEIKYLKEHP